MTLEHICCEYFCFLYQFSLHCTANSHTYQNLRTKYLWTKISARVCCETWITELPFHTNFLAGSYSTRKIYTTVSSKKIKYSELFPGYVSLLRIIIILGWACWLICPFCPQIQSHLLIIPGRVFLSVGIIRVQAAWELFPTAAIADVPAILPSFHVSVHLH